MAEEYLDQKLKAYEAEDVYPFHMPGHKRQGTVAGGDVHMDITEISGFDDLHHATGILKAAQQRAADLYGALESFYLVNGSTVGLLSALFSMTEEGDEIIMARNCHRSIYHAAMLRHLTVHYVYPQWITSGISGNVSTKDVENVLKEHPNVGVVVLTSPTYDGVCTDVEEVANIVHNFHARLLVDEAHGAHFGFHPHYPQSAVRLGADVVVQSLHKTLPSFTQTALLHNQCPELSDALAFYLRIFQTSSPSYLLMAGMEECIRTMQTSGEALCEKLSAHLDWFYKETEKLRVIHIVQPKEVLSQGAKAFDRSRLIILTGKSKLTGPQLAARLRTEYRIEMEMAAGQYVLGISSVMDTFEGFRRLAEALLAIDRMLSPIETKQTEHLPLLRMEKKKEMDTRWMKQCRSVLRKEAVGHIVGEFLYVYPPGIPAIVPGEVYTRALEARVQQWEAMGLSVQGTADESGKYIGICED